MLRESGHPDAAHYPLGMLSDEALLVLERQHNAEANRAALLHLAVSAILSKKAGTEFRKVSKQFTYETFAIAEAVPIEQGEPDGKERR